MSSWRDIASPQAQNDLDQLVGTAIGFAQEQLSAHGEFYPFAFVIDSAGNTEAVRARPASDHPASSELIDACLATLTSRRHQIRATALTADVRIAQHDTDAIQADLEHADGHALTIVLPYTRKRRGRIDYGQINASAGPRHIWPPPDR